MSELVLLSVEELQNLIKEAKLQIAQRQQIEIKKAYQQILQIASSFDMSIEEIVSVGRNLNSKTKSGKSVPPQYANPDNPSQTWTGRGKRPLWVNTKLSSGLTLEALRITD